MGARILRRRQAQHGRHGAAVALACALAATTAQAQPATAPEAAAIAVSAPTAVPAPVTPQVRTPIAAAAAATPRVQAPAVALSAAQSLAQGAPQSVSPGTVLPGGSSRGQAILPPAASPVPAAGMPPASAVTHPAHPAGAPESLQALLARVLPHDPQVRVARSLLQAAEERRVQARSRLAPVAGVSAVRGSSSDIEFGRPLQRRTERAEATLRWNLYNQGNDFAELEGASAEVAAAAQDLRRAREEAAERIALAYADLLRSDELLARADERLAAVSRLRAQVQRQTELGRASEADARQAEASQLDAEIAREQIFADREAARLRLAALTGGEAPGPLPVVLPPATGSAAAPPQPGLVAAAVERAEAARARVRPVASVFAPRVDFEYRQRLSDRTRPQATTEQQHGWLLSARWEFPVGGESLARRAEGERRAEAAEAEADRLRQVVEAERATLDPRSAGAERAVTQLERLSGQYAALLRAGELQYEAGRRTLAQLVLLHDSRFGAEQRRAEQANRLLAARLRQLALGGGLLPALGLQAE